ncbi:hypothetical protein QTG56_24450 (plasmid) [Rossellomorea sp. AcN35-11]|nr:hypothetical protein [Rossellomorea aquimaris]WJV31786.1 hypothetical protein QTG56_24450 [Rossellomorea sp. AcN35-11]
MNIAQKEKAALLQKQKKKFDAGNALEINMQHWSNNLAKHFPKILAHNNEKARVIEFLDEHYELEEENDLSRVDKDWEEWEIQFLKNRIDSPLRYHHIAISLGRSVNEIRVKVLKLGIR